MDLVFYLSPKGLFAANCNHNHSQYSNWVCKILDINTKTDIFRSKQRWFTKSCGLHYAQNISLSRKLITKIDPSSNQTYKPCNILFKCGGRLAMNGSNKCSAIILEKSQLVCNDNMDSNLNVMTLYHWKFSLRYLWCFCFKYILIRIHKNNLIQFTKSPM